MLQISFGLVQSILNDNQNVSDCYQIHAHLTSENQEQDHVNMPGSMRDICKRPMILCNFLLFPEL